MNCVTPDKSDSPANNFSPLIYPNHMLNYADLPPFQANPSNSAVDDDVQIHDHLSTSVSNSINSDQIEKNYMSNEQSNVLSNSEENTYFKFPKLIDQTMIGHLPPPPTSSVINCNCIRSTLKFGLPFVIFVFVGAFLNYVLNNSYFGSFLQTWTPILFIFIYLRLRFFRMVISIELLLYFWLVFLFVLPYSFFIGYLYKYADNHWNVNKQTPDQWLSVSIFLQFIFNSFFTLSAVIESYKILILWTLSKRQIIACPTSLFIYSIIISAAISSAMESIIIKDKTESVWIAILITLITVPFNIATGVYIAMYFSIRRFKNKSKHMIKRGKCRRTTFADSMDLQIVFDSEKQKFSSKKLNINNYSLFNKCSTNETQIESKSDISSKTKETNVVENENDIVANDNINDNAINKYFDIGEYDFDLITEETYKEMTLNTTLDKNGSGLHCMPYEYNVGNDDESRCKSLKYIMLSNAKSEYLTNFYGYGYQLRIESACWIFIFCGFVHGIIHLLVSFINILFSECYASQISEFDDQNGCSTNDEISIWIVLLWILVVCALLIVILFIGYVRHLWLFYFKDGAKVNVHYMIIMNEIRLPFVIRLLWCWFRHCYECEVRSAYNDYGVLLSSSRDTRLNTEQQIEWDRVKKNITST